MLCYKLCFFLLLATILCALKIVPVVVEKPTAVVFAAAEEIVVAVAVAVEVVAVAAVVVDCAEQEPDLCHAPTTSFLQVLRLV